MAALSRRPWGKIAPAVLCLAAFLAPASPASPGPGEDRASDVPLEYQVKAAFMLNFARFVEWPASAFPEASAPLHVVILGDDSFGDALIRTFAGQTVGGRALVVRHEKVWTPARKLEDLASCQILFVSRSESGALEKLFADLKGIPILTVGETESFARDGGVINFVTESGKVRFEINPDAASAAGLKISSKLLSLSRIVKTDPVHKER